MALIVFEHDPLESPARLGAVLRDSGHKLRVIELHAGDPLPPDLDDVDGLVSLGGPMNVDEENQYPWMAGEMDLIRQAHETKLPVVGICLGAQLIAKALGGEVAAMQTPETGYGPVKLAFPGTIDPIMSGIPWTSPQFHLHGQEITKLPGGATPLAASKATKNQAFKVGLTTYAFQYHFEWTREQIEAVLDQGSELLQKAGVTPDAIREQAQQHHELYRHLGDRLAQNLTDLLFPLDKRLGGRRGERETTPVKNWRPAES